MRRVTVPFPVAGGSRRWYHDENRLFPAPAALAKAFAGGSFGWRACRAAWIQPYSVVHLPGSTVPAAAQGKARPAMNAPSGENLQIGAKHRGSF
ncbi:hypothetical protein [Chitinophaga sp. 22620]|uniref:hypothetical protein n=1 Tax=Chitinophaga sp. 22620 TaxID=3453952 RepID=UPI003F84A9BE